MGGTANIQEGKRERVGEGSERLKTLLKTLQSLSKYRELHKLIHQLPSVWEAGSCIHISSGSCHASGDETYCAILRVVFKYF